MLRTILYSNKSQHNCKINTLNRLIIGGKYSKYVNEWAKSNLITGKCGGLGVNTLNAQTDAGLVNDNSSGGN